MSDDGSDDDDDMSMPGLVERRGDNNGSTDDDDSDSDSDSDAGRRNPGDGGDMPPPLMQGDDDSSNGDSDDSSVPSSREDAEEEKEEESDDDSDDSDASMPGLVERKGKPMKKTSNKAGDSDADSDADDMPALMTNANGDSSSDDDSSSDESNEAPKAKPQAMPPKRKKPRRKTTTDTAAAALNGARKQTRGGKNAAYDLDDDDTDDDLPPLNDVNDSDDSDEPTPKKATASSATAAPSKKKKQTKHQREKIEKQKREEEKKKVDTERKRKEDVRRSMQVEKKKKEDAKKKKEAEKKRKEDEAKRKAAEMKAEAERKEAERKINASIVITTAVRGFVVRRRMHKFSLGFVQLQALVRGKRTRKMQIYLIERLQDLKSFRSVWKPCLKLVDGVIMAEPDWAALRDKQAYIRRQEVSQDDEMDETDRKLTAAMEDAMQTDQDADFDKADVDEEQAPDEASADNANGDHSSNSNSKVMKGPSSPAVTNFKRIHLSGDVVKWLRQGDRKYKDFFIRRMKQLSSGERSRILAKRLVGSVETIYETYLEQKSGFRILWTEKDDFLLVWYVAKHKNVSRLMQLIDDSKNRSERQRIAISDIEEFKEEGAVEQKKDKHHVFLDPLGNVPLKVYDVSTADIDEIAQENWTPGLHLTEEERDVVETQGTVLLLGRSGTGKTVCICNRMELDRQKFNKQPSFSQLFVARSPRLCNYVKETIGAIAGCTFTTFDTVLTELEAKLPKVESVRDSFPESHQMTFRRFKQEVYNGGENLDVLIAWTNIRSFIKGSIEAMQNPTYILAQEEYVSYEHFGKKRCRLPEAQREIAYRIFLKYQQRMHDEGLWDNCDRIVALLQRLQEAKTSDPDIFQEVKRSKIYVDEVQDYTQAECLLFFYLSGPGDLFLAGDPAQNVVKGVEFRFEDIRSVGYYVAGNRPDLIPQKPKIVNINFRSHAGILDAAAAILSQMFSVFPESAQQLENDDGLFQGPRPGIFHKVQTETIASLVAERLNGAVILTHDENVKKCQEMLGGYKLVYGIRAAKGLEFKSVIVLDFFSSLPNELQKPWREMLLGRAKSDFNMTFPEVEGQLKLLYTAVTRCIERLFFAETKSTVSGDAFVRWMTTNSVKGSNPVVKRNKDGGQAIATLNNIKDIENMTMTQDEWLASGISNAEAAEAEESSNHEHAQSLMDKAIYCFEQANNDSFARKARTQLASFRFRHKVLVGEAFGHKSEMEMEAAQLMEKLLRENLLLEARGLGKDVQVYLQEIYTSSDFLGRMLVQKLPGEAYAY